MSDITDLFRSISPDTPEPDAATIEGDLARGRTALVRAHRRSVVRRSVFATGTLAVGVVVAVAATQTGGGSAATNDAGPAHHIKAHHAASAVNLVAYTGKQLEGFTVDRVPAGWHLSTSTQYALLVTANGSTDDDPRAAAELWHSLGPAERERLARDHPELGSTAGLSSAARDALNRTRLRRLLDAAHTVAAGAELAGVEEELTALAAYLAAVGAVDVPRQTWTPAERVRQALEWGRLVGRADPALWALVLDAMRLQVRLAGHTPELQRLAAELEALGDRPPDSAAKARPEALRIGQRAGKRD